MRAFSPFSSRWRMMILYERPTSGHSYKVRLLLSILRVPYESTIITAEHGRNVVDRRYLAMNPRGQIPTLDDDGLVRWGSTAILFYLAGRYDGERTWLPESIHSASEIMQWMEFAQNEVQGLFLSRAIQKFGYPGDLPSAQLQGNRALDILDARLNGRNWLCGDGQTIADIACFPYVALSFDNGFDLRSRKAVTAWIRRMTQLDGFIALPGMEPLEAYLAGR
ncbi:MAG TPA: glutathione S-transferase family protein [Burkholderiaceae bacterium]